MTVDHVVAADVVLADGRQVHADAEHEPELFWAIRGGGLSVGVVTAFEFEAVELPEVIYAEMAFDASDTAQFLLRWADLVTSAPRELTSFMQIDAARAGQPPVARVQVVWADDDTVAAIAVLEQVLGLGPVLAQQAQQVPYAALVAPGDGRHGGQQQIKLRNGFIDHLTLADAEALTTSLTGDPIVRLELRSMGGAVADVAVDATAFAHRSEEIFVAAWALPTDPQLLDQAWASVIPRFSGSYSTYSSDTRAEAGLAAFPAATYARLAQIKQSVDPDGLFGGISLHRLADA